MQYKNTVISSELIYRDYQDVMDADDLLQEEFF